MKVYHKEFDKFTMSFIMKLLLNYL